MARQTKNPSRKSSAAKASKKSAKPKKKAAGKKPKKASAGKKPAARGRTRTGAARRTEDAPPIERSHFPVEYLPDPEPGFVRAALAGRGREFGGIAFVCLGLLLGMSVYADVAGPLGAALESALSSLIGTGRFAAPVLVLWTGVSMVRGEDPGNRFRTGFGWLVLGASALGMVHVVWGAVEPTAESLARSGGWVGWLAGQPLTGVSSRLAATVILLAVAFCGVLIVTGSGPIELWRRLLRWRNAEDVFPPEAWESDDRTGGASVLYDFGADDLGFGARPVDAPVDGANGASVAAVAEDDLEDEVQDPTAPPRRAAKARSRRAADPSDPTVVPRRAPGEWTLPPASSLSTTRQERSDDREARERGARLVEALTEHGVDTELVGWTRGPTVTRFELSLGGGVKVARVTSLSRDIAYAMAATDVRILAPIPGRSAIGIEVPNSMRELVALGDLMAAAEARAASHPLEVAIGKDISGRAVFLNVAAAPHMLVAGTTGAGKSSVINCIVTSILMRSTPDDVRLILIDPKQVEMAQYSRLPHLLTPPVTNPKKAANALGWAVKEMDRRYDLLAGAGFRDIVGYNAAIDRGEFDDDGAPVERMPYILVIVDELNDLMMVAARDVEDCITRIAQKARAVGIHLIVATQRPSVNVITGVIKANIPARMAFAVSSLTDSRVILDQPGAEKLVGRGDMLLLPGNTSVAQRLQSAWVDEDEVRKVVGHWRRQAPEVVYVDGVDADAGGDGGGALGGDGDDDELLWQAIDLVVRTGQGSTSMLQRKLKVGFSRAGRLMDLLESRGVVGPSGGSKAREVLMTVEELEAMRGGD